MTKRKIKLNKERPEMLIVWETEFFKVRKKRKKSKGADQQYFLEAYKVYRGVRKKKNEISLSD